MKRLEQPVKPISRKNGMPCLCGRRGRSRRSPTPYHQHSVVVDEAVRLTSYVASIMEFTQPGSYFCSITALGWGLPASLGISLATSRKPVVALVGDGSALFGIQALWSGAKYQIPVIMVILNNRGYAAVKWGLASYPERKSAEGADLGYDLGNVDFPKLAQSFVDICGR